MLTRATRAAAALMVPARTGSPGPLSTGSDSPVSHDSSRLELPEMISASSGTRSPGAMTMVSPTATLSMATASCFPSRTTVACRGARSMSLRMAADAERLVRASRYFPSVMKTRIIPASMNCMPCRPATQSAMPAPYAAVVPKATSVSMLADRLRSRRAAPARNGQPTYPCSTVASAACSSWLAGAWAPAKCRATRTTTIAPLTTSRRSQPASSRGRFRLVGRGGVDPRSIPGG